MSDDRRRERTVVESGFGGSPAPGNRREPTLVEDGPGYATLDQIRDAWRHATPPPQGAQPASSPRRRDATIVEEPVNSHAHVANENASESNQPSARAAGQRRIAGWLLSSDCLESHILRLGTNLVGRGSDNDVIVADPLVSGLQCNVICEEGRTMVMPRPEARNATQVDGQNIYHTAALVHGSTVSFASSSYTYVEAPWRSSQL